ncbi:MAG: ABC transporter substrate binding protein [Desulfuromonadaceae bacterium]|nr:ABC transporter substrate binding protein [Desulfuromonadaceae bacterium]
MRLNGSVILWALALSFVIMFTQYSPALSTSTSTPHIRKIFKLLILDSQQGHPYNEVRASLLNALANFGYSEGKNLETTIMFSGNNVKKGELLLNDELKNSYDVIFVGGTAATLSAKNALYGKTQPVIFASSTDPVGIGVIQDFNSKLVANFTGVCYPVPVKTRLKFIRKLMPTARTFGLIYADMPQSHSYNSWIEKLLRTDPEFKDIRIIFRSVPSVTGEHGSRIMAVNAKKYIQELDPKVDAYITPCDQMGTRKDFSKMVYSTSRKPLIGLVKDDVMDKWGAVATIYPSHESIGFQAARMIKELFEGKKISDILPEWPHRYGVAIDLKKAKKFGIDVPIELLQMAGENIIH